MSDPLLPSQNEQLELTNHVNMMMSIAHSGRENYKRAVGMTFELANRSQYTQQEIIAEMVKQGYNVEDVFGVHYKAQLHLKEIDPTYEILIP